MVNLAGAVSQAGVMGWEGKGAAAEETGREGEKGGVKAKGGLLAVVSCLDGVGGVGMEGREGGQGLGS